MLKTLLLLFLSLSSVKTEVKDATTLPEKYNHCFNESVLISRAGICGEVWTEKLVIDCYRPNC